MMLKKNSKHFQMSDDIPEALWTSWISASVSFKKKIQHFFEKDFCSLLFVLVPVVYVSAYENFPNVISRTILCGYPSYCQIFPFLLSYHSHFIFHIFYAGVKFLFIRNNALKSFTEIERIFHTREKKGIHHAEGRKKIV